MTQTDNAPSAEEITRWLAAQPCPGWDTPDGLIICTKGRIDCGYEEFHYEYTRCPHCNGALDFQHKACKGTGLAFEWASDECVECNRRANPEDCLGCHGSGRVPKNVGLATVLYELRRWGGVFDIGPGWFHMARPGDGGIGPVGARDSKLSWHWETEDELTLATLHAIAAQTGMPEIK